MSSTNETDNVTAEAAEMQADVPAGLKGIKITPGKVVLFKTIEIGLGALIMTVAGWITGKSYFALLFAGLVPTTHAILIGLALAVPFFVIFELAWWIRKKLGVPTLNSEAFIAQTGVGGKAVHSLAAGIGEEILFRGAIQAVGGIWVSSALFGLMHWCGNKSWGYMISTFIMGFTLGMMYVVTGSLWVPIIVHAINNFLSFTVADRLRALLPQ